MEKSNFSYLSAYMFAYAALGAFMPLVGQYLNSIGFTGTQIGSAVSAGTAVAIAAGAFWGSLYNKSASKKRFVLKLAMGAASVCILLYFVHTYVLFMALFCAMYFFQAPTLALVDAMAVEDGQMFGAARKWGAVGFALGVFFAGKLSESAGLPVIFFIYAGGFAIFAGIVFAMSAAKGAEGTGSVEASGKANEGGALAGASKAALFKNRKYVVLVICAFFMYGTITANNTYFGFLFLQGGGTIAGLGLAFLLMSGSEAPFMAWADKLAKVFTLEKTLPAAMLLSAARFAWYSTHPPHTLLLCFFFLQGMSTGIVIVEFVRYIAKIVDSGNLGFAISIYYALGSSLSAIFCQLAGGIILDHFGAGGIYVFFACMNLTGAIVYIAGKLYKNQE